MITELVLMFLIGICLGSLGSVLLTRLHENINRKTIKSILIGRSHCPHCQHQLVWWQIIPIVGYMIQRGKCYFCKKKISLLYPTLEIIIGITFVTTYFFLQNSEWTTLIFWLTINRSMVIIGIYDVQHKELFFPGWIITIITIIIFSIFLKTENIIFGTTYCLIMSTIFIGIYYLGKTYSFLKRRKRQEGFGEGDIYMVIAIGYILGIYLGGIGVTKEIVINEIIYQCVVYTMIASILGIFQGLIINLISKKKTDSIGFIPAMVIAMWITIGLKNILFLT